MKEIVRRGKDIIKREIDRKMNRIIMVMLVLRRKEIMRGGFELLLTQVAEFLP
jgi:hypothetical protein